MTGFYIMPEEARCFFNLRSTELDDQIVPLAQILPAYRRGLDPLCPEAITRHLHETRCGTALSARAARLLRGSRGVINLDRLCKKLDVSPRHLRRAFADAAGMGLKAYARSLRAQAAIEAADAASRPNWAQIAHRTGYSDQAHLCREIRELIGLTPSAIHRERRAESDLFNPSANQGSNFTASFMA